MELFIKLNHRISIPILIDDDDYDRVKDINLKIDGNYVVFKKKVEGRLRTIYLHRFIMNLSDIRTDDLVVDHKNGDTFDNRKGNLRVCTPKENSRNRRSKTKYGYRGIVRRYNEYQANIYVDGKRITSPFFKNPEDAAKFYDSLAVYYFGEFANLNFPDEPIMDYAIYLLKKNDTENKNKMLYNIVNNAIVSVLTEHNIVNVMLVKNYLRKHHQDLDIDKILHIRINNNLNSMTLNGKLIKYKVTFGINNTMNEFKLNPYYQHTTSSQN